MRLNRLAAVPGARRLADSVVPSRRRLRDQWRRIDAAVPVDVVQSGPFQGMRLQGRFTGSHIPKRLGSYELELHDLITGMQPYDTLLDVGSVEGFYVVGLGRLWPEADVHGFEISPQARRECAAAATVNGVQVQLHGPATPQSLAALVRGRTLLIVDAEGAEAEVLDPQVAPGLLRADLLVELHEFAAPGVTDLLLRRFAGHEVRVIQQERRDPSIYPLLVGLSADDQRRAVDESRVPDQTWLWMTPR